EQHRQRLIEASAEEMCSPDYNGRPAATGAWAETQRGLDMLNCRIRLPGPQPDDAADMPASCEARVERQRTVGQRHHCADVFVEIRECQGGICQRARVVSGCLQGPARQLNSLASVRFRIIAVA